MVVSRCLFYAPFHHFQFSANLHPTIGALEWYNFRLESNESANALFANLNNYHSHLKDICFGLEST